MADPAIALVNVTNDKETRHAIGQFIDSFGMALRIYIMQCPPGYEQDDRVHAAWSYATSVLSHGPPATSLHAIRSTSSTRLSETEADVFWRVIFKEALPQVKLPASKTKGNIEYPIVHTGVDPREILEWNPTAMIPPKVDSRELPVTNIDCMIAIGRWLHWDTRHDFLTLNLKTQAIVSAPIWSLERMRHVRKIPRSVQEGMIVTALLVEVK